VDVETILREKQVPNPESLTFPKERPRSPD